MYVYVVYAVPGNNMENKATVLIVDDDPNNLRVLFEYLEESGFEVSVARSGKQALHQMERFKPDLILLDVMMPGMDGFETCRQLKAHKATRDIPVIFLTAFADSVHKVKGFLAGGVDYITKPLQYEEVLARINAYITIRQLERRLHAQQIVLAEKERRIREQQRMLDGEDVTQVCHDLYERLLAFISYDLQQPFHNLMRSIRLLVENIDDYGKNEFKGHIHRVETDAQELYATHENLLIWTAYQRGILGYTPEPVDLHELAAHNIARSTLQAEKKKITLSSSVQQNMLVYADYNMLDIVIRNLLSNAVRFTDAKGNVGITARALSGPENAITDPVAMIECAVSDTGIGIDSEKIPSLFRMQASIHPEEKVGLGLLLCQELVEKHGGRIWCTSEIGKGTTVSFTVPAAQKT